MGKINTRVQQKIDTSENWAKATNFKPLEGEIIVYSDLNKIKIGDGENYVNDLEFMSAETPTGDGQGSTIIGSGEASGTNSVVIGTGAATGEGATVIGSGEASGEGAIAIGGGTASGDYSVAEGADTIAGCKGYYIQTIVPNVTATTGYIYLHTGENSVIPRWENPEHDISFVSGYEILDENIVPYGNEFSVGSDSYYHWPFAGIITEISGNRITYYSETLNTSDRWLSNVNNGADPCVFFIPAQDTCGIVNVGLGSHAEGWETHAAAQHSHTEGYASIVAGRYGHAEGFGTRAGYAGHSEGQETLAVGLYSHAEGKNSKAQGSGAHTEGSTTTASGNFSHAEGSNTTALGMTAHAEGYYTLARGICTHAEGEDTSAYGYRSHAEGQKTAAVGAYSHVEGYSKDKPSDIITDLSRDSTFNDIYNVWQNQPTAHKFAIAIGGGSHVEGRDCLANTYAHAEGNATIASGDSSHSEGGYETITYDYDGETVSQIFYTEASSKFSHAEGAGTKATNIGAHSEGGAGIFGGYHNFEAVERESLDTIASGEYSHAEGVGTGATNYGAHAEGVFGEANGVGAHVEGYYGEGSYYSIKNIASGTGSHAEGAGTKAMGFASHAEGGGAEDIGDGFWPSQACGNYSHVEGYMTQTGKYNSPMGIGAHAEGLGLPLNSYVGHLEDLGYDYNFTTAYGNGSHAEGLCTVAYGNYQHTQGRFNKVDYDGKYAHIVGNGIYDENEWLVTPSNAHTLDWDGNAWFAGNVYTGGSSQDDSKAVRLATTKELVGKKTTGEIFNDYTNNIATGSMSHAEGTETQALGFATHAEGRSSKAYGYYGHAEGYGTVVGDANNIGSDAPGKFSHAEGNATIAYSKCQHVQGKYNIKDTEEKYAHIVGNGTSQNNRRNAHTLDWDGNAWFAGNISTDGAVNCIEVGAQDISCDNLYLNGSLKQIQPDGTFGNTITVPVPGTSTAIFRMLFADSKGNMNWMEVQKASGIVTTFDFGQVEIGMTWAEWVNSDYNVGDGNGARIILYNNTIGFVFVGENGSPFTIMVTYATIEDRNNCVNYIDIVKPTDVIIPNVIYGRMD